MSDDTTEESCAYPGQSLGLPASGRGSLASWRSRVAAIICDWAACTLAAMGLFGIGVMTESGWKVFATLMVFYVESTVLTTFAGGSFGQLIAGIRIVRLDGTRLCWWRVISRTALKCLGLPSLVVGAERRTLPDLIFDSVVIRK